MSPSAVIMSTEDTAVARFPLVGPEPWVAVAHEPATEMCGSEPRLCSASPAAWSRSLSSPYRTPAETVTDAV